MSKVTFKGTPIDIAGELPAVGRKSPDFKRFCESNKLTNVVTLSTFRSPAFGRDYGVRIAAGPLAGLTSRAVVVLDGNDKVIYAEQVPEIAQEPDYAAALAALP